LPANLVACLAQACGGTRAAVASCAGRRQPVFCLLPVTAAGALAAALASGERRPAEFLRQLDAAEAVFDDRQAFANINVMESVAPGALRADHG